MIFRCNKMKGIRIPNFELNNVLLTRVTKYKYLGHCISDDLKVMMMTWRGTTGKFMRRAMHYLGNFSCVLNL